MLKHLSLPLLASVLGILACSSPELNAYSAGHRALIEAWKGIYPPTAYLSGGIAISSTTSSRRPKRQDLNRRAVALIEAEVSREKTARTLAAKGTLLLLLQRTEMAVETLRRATLEPDCPPAVWSDLAAALFVRARARSDAYGLVEALAAAQRAIKSEPSMPQALFNRFVVLEELQLNGAAAEALQVFLENCHNSEWCAVARTHLHPEKRFSLARNTRQALRRQAARNAISTEVTNGVMAAPQAARIYLEEELLANWAAEVGTEKGGSQTAQKFAMLLGQQLKTASGDRLPLEEAACLESGNPHLAELIVGLRAYQEALTAYRNFEIERAETGFHQSAGLLEHAQCPFAWWAKFYQAVCWYYRKDFPAAEHTLSMIESIAERRGYVNLAGRAGWMRGLSAAAEGRPTNALTHYQRALVRFEASREEGNQAALHSMMAGAWRHLGNPLAEWNHRVQALRLLNRYGDFDRLNVVLSEIALDLAANGEIASAILVQTEVIESLHSDPGPAELAEALWLRARLHMTAGDTKLAFSDLAAARNEVAKVASPAVQHHLQILISLAEGTLERARSPEIAFRTLNRVVTFAEKQLPVMLGEALLQRARTSLILGRLDNATSDLENAIVRVEHRRAEVEDEGERIGLFGQSRDLFEEMIQFQWDRRQDRLAALEFADRGKARVLLDQVARKGRGRILQSLSREALALIGTRSARSRTTIVAFTLTEKRGFCWVSSGEGWRGQEIAADRQSLATEIARLRTAAANSEQAVAQAILLHLSNTLFKSFWPRIANAQHLVVVPDASLSLVPFAALMAPDSRRFVEHFEVTVVPSLAVMQELIARPRQPKDEQGGPRVLVVASPRFDRTRYPYLSHLDAASDEAAELRAAYRRSTVLLEEAASPAAVVAASPGAMALHFAVHALVDERHPELSRLVLASGDGGNGDFRPAEIARLDLSGSRLVVLAACSTSTGGEAPLEGVLDLARPFLAAGAPAVVTTLWDIDDKAARRFFVKFHNRFARSFDAAAALRETQLEALRSTLYREDLAAWAAFQLVGVPTSN